jgi:hypothetical protein
MATIGNACLAHLAKGIVSFWHPSSNLHLAKRFQGRRFLKISQSETRIAFGGHVC